MLSLLPRSTSHRTVIRNQNRGRENSLQRFKILLSLHLGGRCRLDNASSVGNEESSDKRDVIWPGREGGLPQNGFSKSGQLS